MPAFGTPIVINDGQTTPVAHTFNPANKDGKEVFHYVDRAGGIPIGYGRLGVQLKRPPDRLSPGSTARADVFKISAKIDIPVLEVTSPSTSSGIQPAPTVAYTETVWIEFTVHGRSTEQNRKDILAYAKNLLNDSLLNAMVVNLESVHG